MTARPGLRTAIVRALELLDDGNTKEAEAFLRSALRRPPKRGHYRCDRCGLAFKWPGELDNHRRLSSCSEDTAA
jgi:hypothetical protein